MRGDHTRKRLLSSRRGHDQHTSIASIFESRPDQSLNVDLSPIYFEEGTDSYIAERSYQTLLPVVKQLVKLYKEHPELEKLRELKIACAVCRDLTQVRGWGPLLIHAQKFWKSYPLQHKGYHRALEEVLRNERFASMPAETMAWPPILLVENGGLTFDGSLRRWKGLQGVEVPENLKDMEIEEVLAVYKRGNGGKRNVMVFPAAEVGLVDAKKLAELLEKSPKVDDWVKFRIEKVHSSSGSPGHEHSIQKDGALKKSNLEAEQSDSWKKENDDKGSCPVSCPSTSGTHFDYDQHHPLGTWSTLKEIRETSSVDTVMRKWAKSFASGSDYCTFAYKWPFQKSRKLKEMDIKFQQDLQKYHSLGAAGNEKLRTQLEEIEKQLRKERLLWLKEIREVRDQFEGLEKDIKKEEAQKALDKYIWEMRLERDIAAEMEELEELMHEKDQLHVDRSSSKKRQQAMQKMERKRDALIKVWKYEQNQLKKQVELAKEERDCISANLEHEEMLDALNRVLEGCECMHGDEKGDSSCSIGNCSKSKVLDESETQGS